MQERPLALSIALAAGALAGAAALQLVLRRLTRRLARRRAAESGPPPAAYRLGELLALLGTAAGWIAAASAVLDVLPPLKAARVALHRCLVMALTAPLLTAEKRGYSATDLLAIPALIAALWLAIGAAARLVQTHVLARAGVARGAQESVSTLLRYVLMLLGVLVVLQAWGLNARSLVLAVGVLGVGIGFGLQNIANNFVSGILIGFERPITPGDFVQLGALSGTVVKIGARSTQVRTGDGATILVPNSRFLEQEVINWSHGDPTSRLRLPVGVAYGSDLASARAALLEAARGEPAVLRDPRPQVRLVRLGENALELELLAWIADRREEGRIASALLFRVEAGLKRRGIEIPFPQRDLNLRSALLDRALELWIQEKGGASALPSPMPDATLSALPPAGTFDIDVEALARRLYGENGVAIEDRRHLATVYRRCFVGREAVDWLVRSEELTREEAVAVGQLLVENGTIHHVLDEHPFKDGRYFYRFRADEERASSAGSR